MKNIEHKEFVHSQAMDDYIKRLDKTVTRKNVELLHAPLYQILANIRFVPRDYIRQDLQ